MSAVVLMSVVSFAQKIGHIDRTALIKAMPETAEVEKKLSGIQEQYASEFQAMEQDYNKLVQEAQANGNTWPEAIRQTKIKAIQDKEQQIAQFEQTATTDIQEQQAALYQPIIDKAGKAISDVAKENGFIYIIDSSLGVLLYTGGEDIMELVKTKLTAMPAPAAPKQ